MPALDGFLNEALVVCGLPRELPRGSEKKIETLFTYLFILPFLLKIEKIKFVIFVKSVFF